MILTDPDADAAHGTEDDQAGSGEEEEEDEECEEAEDEGEEERDDMQVTLTQFVLARRRRFPDAKTQPGRPCDIAWDARKRGMDVSARQLRKILKEAEVGPTSPPSHTPASKRRRIRE